MLRELLVKHLNWDEGEIDEFMAEFTSEYEAICKVIKNGIDKSKQPIFYRAKFEIRLSEVGWIEQWKAKEVLKEATALELEVITKLNPYYAHMVYCLPMEACAQLVGLLKLDIPDYVKAYMVLWKELDSKRFITRKELDKVLVAEGLGNQSKYDLSLVRPFGPNVLRGHPLEHVDIEATPPCKTGKYLAHAGEIIPRTRERTWLDNRIVLRGDRYTRKNNDTELIELIHKLNHPHT